MRVLIRDGKDWKVLIHRGAVVSVGTSFVKIWNQDHLESNRDPGNAESYPLGSKMIRIERTG